MFIVTPPQKKKHKLVTLSKCLSGGAGRPDRSCNRLISQRNRSEYSVRSVPECTSLARKHASSDVGDRLTYRDLRYGIILKGNPKWPIQFYCLAQTQHSDGPYFPRSVFRPFLIQNILLRALILFTRLDIYITRWLWG